MKRILVTGSSGFIGSALKKKLEESGEFVKGVDASKGYDISDESTFNKLDYKDYSNVIHLAGKLFIPDSWNNPGSFYKTNLFGTENILEFCRRGSIPLVYISAYLYGQPEKLPISEDDEIRPNNPYAHSKYLAEELCKFYSEYFGLKIGILRPFNVFGIGQNKSFLIPRIIDQAINTDKIVVMSLVPKRDYIYLEDLINAIVAVKNNDRQFSVYNIGSGYSLSVKEVINTVQKVLNISKDVVSDNEERPNEIYDVVSQIERAKKDLNWEPQYSFHDGITKIIESEVNK
jgi:nucleoside-diphosphate-sugar epimerase